MKLLIWLIYPVAEAAIQAYMQKRYNWKPIYFQLFIIRGFFAIIFGALVLRMPYDMILWWSFVGWVTGSFFAVFDPLLNEFKDIGEKTKKPFVYTGENSGWINEAIGDRAWMYISFYIFSVLLAVASFIVYNYHNI